VPLAPLLDPACWLSLPGSELLRELGEEASPLWLPELMEGSEGREALLPPGVGMEADGKLLELEELEELGCDGEGILDDGLDELLDDDDDCDGGLTDGEEDEEELDEEEGMLGMDDWLEDCWLLDSQATSTRLNPPSISIFATNRLCMTVILCVLRKSRNLNYRGSIYIAFLYHYGAELLLNNKPSGCCIP